MKRRKNLKIEKNHSTCKVHSTYKNIILIDIL